MVHVRFAPSPTGSLHLGSALTAVANRAFADERGGTMLLRIDDTDAARTDPAAEAGVLRDLDWLGVGFDEGPIRQSERAERHREAARAIGTEDEDGALRLGRTTLVRADGRPTYHLASVVDDVDFAITHVIRGSDHRANEPLHGEIARALGADPPEYVHHGLILAPEGGKLSKRHGAGSLADLSERGIPAGAVRRYLEELGLPRNDVQLDEPRLRRLAIEVIAAASDEELAEAVGVPSRLAPALRGARDLVEARAFADGILSPPWRPLPADARPTLDRFRDLLATADGELDEAGAKALLRELKAVGGDLRTLRLALTGAERGPELWTVLVALPADEALGRANPS
jgi:glutamyl-tRNA synthetase